MGAYPWGFTGVTPNATDNIADHGSFTGEALKFTDDGALPGGARAPLRGARRRQPAPTGGEAAASGGAYRGPQGRGRLRRRRLTSLPKACDDGPFGNGTGGELRYRVSVPGKGTARLWVAAAGSDRGADAARDELDAALADPAAALAAKVAARDKLSKWSQVSLPGDRQLQDAIDWGKQNLADTTQTASDLQIRWTNQGKQFPAPLGTVAHARWFGAGYPDYPWIFATDGEYTNFAAVALGQFEVAEDHLRAARHLRRPQRPLGHRRARGRLGRIDLVRPRLGEPRHEDQRLQHRRDRQVPERRGAHLALDGRRPLPRRDVRLRQAQPPGRRSPARRRPRRLAGGLGQRRADGHGPGEARQRRLLHPLALRPGRHGALQARPRDRAVGHRPGAQAAAPVRGHVVEHRRRPVRGLADRARQQQQLPGTGIRQVPMQV